MTITRKRRRKINMMQGWLLWFALTAAFSLMGVGMAAFQGNLLFAGTVGTAKCFVELSDPYIHTVTPADRNPQGETVIQQDDELLSNTLAYEISLTTPEIEKKAKDNSPELSASLDSGNKNIEISVANAYPGDVYRLLYDIGNKGTVPIKITSVILSDNPGLRISDPSTNYRLEPGEIKNEELMIAVNENVVEKSNYGFAVQLSYEQWN